MVRCETIIAAQTNVNAETDVLAAIAGTSLTTRSGWGKPKITHAAAFVDTNDIGRVWVLPSGYNDANGFEIESVNLYSATADFRATEFRLPIPVEVPENTPLVISAQSETAANTAIQVWLMLEYPNGGSFMDAPATAGGLVKRNWESGAAATSNVPYAATNINDLQAGKKYRIVGVGKGAVNGETAGCVGPAYFGLNQKYTDGTTWFVPLCNNTTYVTGNGRGWVDFRDCGIKSPIIDGGTPFETRCLDFTAEQPQGVIQLAVDKPVF